MKKVFVAGSTGLIGQQFVKEALRRGIKVTTLTPDLKSTKIEKHKDLELIEGTILDDALVSKTLKDHKYVLSTLGDFDEYNPDQSVPHFRVKGTKHLIKACRENSIQKLVVLLGASLLKDKDGNRIFDLPDPSSHIEALATDFEQTRRMWETWNLLQESGINWTAFCPGKVVPGEKSSEYTVEADHLCDEVAMEKVVVGDLVDAIINEFEKDQLKGKLVGIKTKSMEKTFKVAQ